MDMKKILVVNVNWVGDVIFSSPVFTNLKKKYPDSHITCLAVPRVKDILESVEGVDEIIVYDEKGRDWGLWAKLRLVIRLKKKEFDSVFLLHGSWTRAILMYFAQIPVRVGYPTKNRGKLLTHCTKACIGVIHRCDYYLNVIEDFGIPIVDRSTNFKITPAARKEIGDILSKHNIKELDPYAVLHVGANWDLKRWPEMNFARLIDEIESVIKVKVIIPGSKKDKKAAKRISDHCKVKPILLTGQTNLKQLAALMERAQFVVSADSGPMHIASSVGTKTISLFGPTKPEMTGVRGHGENITLQKDVGCNRSPCYFLECPDNICMKSISVKDVIDAVRKIQSK